MATLLLLSAHPPFLPTTAFLPCVEPKHSRVATDSIFRDKRCPVNYEHDGNPSPPHKSSFSRNSAIYYC